MIGSEIVAANQKDRMNWYSMKQITLTFLVGILYMTCSFAQTAEGIIFWEADKPLAWTDFKGKSVKSSPYHAQTQGALNYTFDNLGVGSYLFKLNVKFDKQKSWSKTEEQTDNLLDHEQGHFDIYEIYGRIIIKRLKETKALTGSKFSDRVEKIFRKAFGELQKFQQEYDKATNHSKNKEKQGEWNEKLEKMLKNLEEHSVKEIQFKV